MKTFGPTAHSLLAPALLAPALLALGILTGCASSEITTRNSYVAGQEIARPGRIIVHSFAASPDEISADAAVAGRYDRRATPQTAEDIALGHKLGDLVATELVKDIQALGFSSERAGSGRPPELNDLVIKGAFVSIDEGSRLKRMLIGFGAGGAELKTFAEGYQVTADGLRPLGSAEVEAGGGKMPGMLVPVAGGAAAGTIATSAAISAGLSSGREYGSESIGGAAERTAEEIAKLLEEGFKKRGWLAP